MLPCILQQDCIKLTNKAVLLDWKVLKVYFSYKTIWSLLQQCEHGSGLKQYMARSALWGYSAACSGSYVPTFWDNLSVPSQGSRNPRTMTNRLSWNVSMELPLCTA